jgi:hypothetical protein
MTTAATSLLGLALPVTGELSGTWGDTVNNSITSLLDSAVAGTTTLSTDADVTLTTTTLAANQAREAIILWTAAGTVTRTITAPAQSKTYVVINKSSTQSIKLVGVGPTTGVTLVAGEFAVVAWNGTDFVKIANTSGAGVFTSISDSGNLTFTGTGNRITGDFSNATTSSRVLFQSSTTNGNTRMGVIPNGTAQISAINFYNNSDPANASILSMLANSSEAQLNSTLTGTGTYLPMTFYTSGTEKLRIAADTTGTYTFGGTAPRITGDFSNATQASRVSIQSSTTDGNTTLQLIPNGAATTSGYTAYNNSTLTNSSFAQYVVIGGTEVRLNSGILGSGTYLPMTFYTGGSERVRVDTSGNVGVGTSSPAAKLDIGTGNLNFSGTGQRITGDFTNATIASRVAFQTSTTNGNTAVTTIPNGTATFSGMQFFNASDPTNSSYLQVGANATFAGIVSGFVGTGSYLPMTFYTGGSERMRLDTSGNLGVGTTSPSYKLDVTGTLHSTGQATFDNAISLNTASLNYLYYNSAISFSENGTGERMRIDSSGNVGIGASSLTSKFTVQQDQAAYSYFDFYNVTNGGGIVFRQIHRNIANTGTDSVDMAWLTSGGFAINNNDTGAANYTAFGVGGSERMRIDSSGNVLVTNAAGLGYGTGAGGTVTQLTSRTTGVTLSKPTGSITMFSAAGSTTAATFTVTNTLVAATDTIILNQKSGTNKYVFLVTAVAAGSFSITFYTTGGTATDAPVINFAIIKGVTA